MDEKVKNKFHILTIIISILSIIASTLFLGYTLLFCSDKVDNLSLIINSFLVFLFVCILSISLFIQNKKYQGICSSISLIFAIIFIVFNFLSLMNVIKVPKQKVMENFVNKNISELITFAEENNIIINQAFDYSDYTLEYYIISQDVTPNTLLKDVKEINVIVSSGANPNKTFTLQSLIGLTIDDAIEIINNNFMSNVEIEYEFSDEASKDIVISQNISGEVKRNDLLQIVVSLGSEDELVPVRMIDLKNKSLFEATLWLKRNGFKYEIVYEFSSEVKRDYCLSQSEKVGDMIDPKETIITLIVSKGAEIIIPDFTAMSVNEATMWISEHNLKVVFNEAYDNEIKKGDIISSNKSMGSKLEEGETIELTISKGRLVMERFDNIESFRAWANSLNLEYDETSQFSDSAAGTIISIDPDVGEGINPSETIKVVYSKGKSTTVPNFYNKSKSEASSLCNNYQLTCYYSYKYSNNISSDHVVSQSLSAGSTVAEKTGITIYLSKGPEPKPTVPVCSSTATHTLIIQPNWITGGTAEATVSTLKSKFSESYPLVTFKFEIKEGNDPSGFIHIDSPINNRSQIQDCKTYTIIINK